MKIFYLLFFIVTLALATIKDFGIVGPTQNITEEGFIKQLNKAILDVNTTKLGDDFKRDYKNVATVNLSYPQCDNNLSITFEPGIILAKNQYTPDGRLIAKAGEKINPLKYVPLHLAVPTIAIIDATNKRELDFVKKQCANKRCVVFTTKGNSIDLSEQNLTIYPAQEEYIKSFQVNCTVTLIERTGTKLTKHQFSLKKDNN